MKTERKHSIMGLIPVIDYLSEMGKDPSPMLADCGIQADGVSQNAIVRQEQSFSLFQRLLKEDPSDTLGIEIGRRISPAIYGSYLLAVMSAPTIEAAMKTQAELELANYGFFHLVLKKLPNGNLRVEFRYLVAEPELDMFLKQRDIAGTSVLIKRIAPEFHNRVSFGVALPMPEKSNLLAYYEHVSPQLLFDCEHSYFELPAELLSHPMTDANPIAHQMFKLQCQRDIDLLYPNEESHSDQIRAILESSQSPPPALEDMAGLLSINGRTLRRKLAEENTSYRELVESFRKKRAMSLLNNRQSRVQDVAKALGYSDSASFITAFRRWTGVSPKEYSNRERL